MITLHTTKGDIQIELFADKAPISVANFISYVDSGYYTGTVFHRIIPGFMVQGGGMDAQNNRKPTQAPIQNEAKNGLKNQVGTLAMARTGEVDSATSQFFINVANNDFLDHGVRDFGYAVFGKVTSGMDVVEAIEKVGSRSGTPSEVVSITGVTKG